MDIVVVCEGPSDVEMLCELADRVLREGHEWLADHEDLSPFRRYRGLDPESRFTAWKEVRRRYAERGLHPGGFKGPPLRNEYQYQGPARKALRLAAVAEAVPDGMIWFVDTDLRGGDDHSRRNGLEAARTETSAPLAKAVAIGVAHPMNEAWVVAGFVPEDDIEEAALQRWTAELGFQPNAHAGRIPRKRAKEVAADVCRGDCERRRRCWAGPDLALLRARGDGCGLLAYLSEAHDRLGPLLDAVR